MHFLRCVLAEWALIRPQVLRTRLGLWLLALGAALLWLGRSADPLTVALQAGAFGAVLAASTAGTATPSLFHPTTPLAVAVAQWLGAVVPATILTVLATLALGVSGQRFGAVVLAGVGAAVAVAGCALAIALLLGRTALVALFLCMAVAGAAPPEHFVAMAEPGGWRVIAASALELGPALWRYRDIAMGDAGALAHAAAWAALGIVVASGVLRRADARAGE